MSTKFCGCPMWSWGHTKPLLAFFCIILQIKGGWWKHCVVYAAANRHHHFRASLQEPTHFNAKHSLSIRDSDSLAIVHGLESISSRPMSSMLKILNKNKSYVHKSLLIMEYQPVLGITWRVISTTFES